MDLILLAEDTGLIVPIGQWVLQEACAQLKVWQTDPHVHSLTLSVNVSAHQFRQSDYVPQVLEVLETAGVDGDESNTGMCKQKRQDALQANRQRSACRLKSWSRAV